MNEVLYKDARYDVGDITYVLKSHTDSFVILDAEGTESVMGRAEFVANARQRRDWHSGNRYVLGATGNTNGLLSAVHLRSDEAREQECHPGQWCIDLSLVPRDAYAWGYDR